jgi:protein TonB
MTTTDIAENRREQAAGLTAALVLHGLGLAFLWHYQLVPPPAKDLAVFVDVIIPATAVKSVALPPPVLKPAPTRPAPPAMPAPRREPVVPSPASVPPAPVITSPKQAVATTAESATPTPPTGTSVAQPLPVAAPAAPRQAAVQEAAPQQPLMLSGELSISCPDRTPPAYPKQSLRLGEQGKTVLLVELDEKGHVARVSVQSGSGYPRLDEAAVVAVRSWRCSPARRHGAAVRSMATQPFNFTIKGR